MNIFILQKSICDLKNPIKKREYNTSAQTVKDFITEMVNKNYNKKDEFVDEIGLFSALEESKSTRFVYENKKSKFSLADMTEFALTAFCDNIFIIKNVTKDIQYKNLSDTLNFSEGDEVVLIKLKYVRGVI